MQIAEFLAEQAVPFEPLAHAPAYSAQKLAKYLHIPGHQVAKSVLLRGPDGLMLAILPASLKVDTELLTIELGGKVTVADDRDINAVFRDCEWGVVPPFGTLYGLPTILDDSLPSDALIVFEGQTHLESLRIRCADFERLEKPRRLSFAQAVVWTYESV